MDQSGFWPGSSVGVKSGLTIKRDHDAPLFFHAADSDRDIEDSGRELADHAAARVAAIRYAGDVMGDRPDVLWDGRDFRVEVTDERGMMLFTIVALAVNASAAGDVK